MILAVCGSSSEIWMPGAEVAIARNGPPVAVPGLWVPTLQLAQPAGHIDHQHPLLRAGQFRGDAGP